MNLKKHILKNKIFNIKSALFFLTSLSLSLFCFILFSFKSNGYLKKNDIEENVTLSESLYSSSEILMPNLVGKSFEELQKEFRKNRELKICILKRKINDRFDKDFIISQIPEKGTFVKRGSVVAVVVSLGATKRQLRKINGNTVFEAASKLSKLGFTPKLKQVHNGNVGDKLIIGYENFNEGEFLDYKSEVNIVQNLDSIN